MLSEVCSYIIEAIDSTDITTPSAIFKMLLSLFLGGAVGFERKRKGQIAGIRTFALISTGATMAMLLSIYVPQEYMGLKNGDPGRIAAQVITGIGFLGAGAIIQMKGSVRGLTTAAGIWVVATIGMAVAVGMYVVAVVTTGFILVILVLFDRYERRVNLIWENKILRVSVTGTTPQIKRYCDVLHEEEIHLVDNFIKVNYDKNETVINFVILLKDNTDYEHLFDRLSSIQQTISIAMNNELNL